MPVWDDMLKNKLSTTVLKTFIMGKDIVVVHWWDHPALKKLVSMNLPDCRMIFWCHKNYKLSEAEVKYPDRFITTSPIQGDDYEFIRSTANMDVYRNLPFPRRYTHEGIFEIGYVGTVDYKKMNPDWVEMCKSIDIPKKLFVVVGEKNIPAHQESAPVLDFYFAGHQENLLPWYESMRVFGYPLRPDHYGTCELVLGEAMSAGVVPVCMDNEAERFIIEHGKNGYLAKDKSEYKMYVERLYFSPETRIWMGEQARIKANEIYNLDKMVGEWDNLFNRMMRRGETEKRGIVL